MSRIHRARQMLRARLLAPKTGTAVVPAQSARPACNSAAPARKAADGAAKPSAPEEEAAKNPPAEPSAAPPRITPPDPDAVPLAA